jgi:hypothetical protein
VKADAAGVSIWYRTATDGLFAPVTVNRTRPAVSRINVGDNSSIEENSSIASADPSGKRISIRPRSVRSRSPTTNGTPAVAVSV